jgi:hypothetical protein
VVFTIDSQSAGVCSIDPTGTTVSFSAVGSCVIDADQAAGEGYPAAPQVQQTVTVGPAPLSIDAGDASVVYGQVAFLTDTVNGFVNGDSPLSAGLTGSGVCSIVPGTPTDVGSYSGAITCGVGSLAVADPNYTLVAGAAATLTITQAPQTIIFTPAVLSSGVTYGRADFRPAGSTSRLPVTFSDASGQCSLDALGRVQITGAGSCTITVSQPGSTDYQAAASVRDTFSIAPAPLRVNARNASAPYGAVPTLSYGLVGFVNGETAVTASLTGSPACSIASGTPSHGGSYPGVITCQPGTLTAPNYSVVEGSSGTLTITKLTQRIHFSAAPVNPTYGGSYSVTATGGGSGNAVTLSIDGLSTSGACSFSGNSVSFTGVGTCIIDANQAGNADYVAAPQVHQRLAIRPAVLTVTAEPKSMPHGGPIPPLTATITGFVNGDHRAGAVTGSPACSTTATTTSRRGSYTIICTTGTLAAANYRFRFVRGTLTVT